MAVTLAPPPAAYVSAADVTPPDAEVPSPPSSRAYLALRSNLPSDRLRGWIVTLSITAIAALTRLWALGWPRTKVFDEVYYATEAKEVLRYGYEDNRGYLFIVHPPLGKWLIAGGVWLSEQLPFTDNKTGRARSGRVRLAHRAGDCRDPDRAHHHPCRPPDVRLDSARRYRGPAALP